MRNSLIFFCFLAFLDEEKLLCQYLKFRFHDSCFDLDRFVSLFKGNPSNWICEAFLWRDDSPVNWRSVNKRWLDRLKFVNDYL